MEIQEEETAWVEGVEFELLIKSLTGSRIEVRAHSGEVMRWRWRKARRPLSHLWFPPVCRVYIPAVLGLM